MWPLRSLFGPWACLFASRKCENTYRRRTPHRTICAGFNHRQERAPPPPLMFGPRWAPPPPLWMNGVFLLSKTDKKGASPKNIRKPRHPDLCIVCRLAPPLPAPGLVVTMLLTSKKVKRGPRTDTTDGKEGGEEEHPDVSSVFGRPQPRSPNNPTP